MMTAWPESVFLCGEIQQWNSTMDSPFTGPIMRRFDVSFTVSLNKLVSKRLPMIWDALPLMWYHCDVIHLIHWGRVTHTCVSELTIIGSDNGLSPGRRPAIIWTNAGILLIRTLGTNFSEILSEIRAFSFKKMHLKMSSAKWRPFCLGLNVL